MTSAIREALEEKHVPRIRRPPRGLHWVWLLRHLTEPLIGVLVLLHEDFKAAFMNFPSHFTYSVRTTPQPRACGCSNLAEQGVREAGGGVESAPTSWVPLLYSHSLTPGAAGLSALVAGQLLSGQLDL